MLISFLCSLVTKLWAELQKIRVHDAQRDTLCTCVGLRANTTTFHLPSDEKLPPPHELQGGFDPPGKGSFSELS